MIKQHRKGKKKEEIDGIATSRPLINSMLIDSSKLGSVAKKIKEIDFQLVVVHAE